jgi:hypothetical protein
VSLRFWIINNETAAIKNKEISKTIDFFILTQIHRENW